MEASTGPLSLPTPPARPNLDKIKRKLLKYGVEPTPKILHNLRKKELQKSNRRIAKRTSKQPPPLTDSQKQEIDEESNLQTIKYEFKKFSKSVGNGEKEKLVGKPWERLERIRLRELANENAVYDGEKLNPENLSELSDIIECEIDNFAWLLDGDVVIEEGWFENDGKRWERPKRSEADAIKLVIDRLSATELSVKDWKFVRIMRYSGLVFTEAQMLKIVGGLGDLGRWRQAISVVEWVYNSKEHRHFKSRYVYTKLLTVLGRARKPREALKIFNLMRGDVHIYPDMAAYHSLAVILGRAGFLKELLNVIDSMKQKPQKFRRRRDWDPVLQPDIVVFNAVLNACVSTCQWKGVSWVFQQLRKNGLRPNGASYGLAMEVMLKSGKYALVHKLFEKMKRNGGALKALTYKVLVRAFWEEGKVDEAARAVRDMERRGIVGTTSVYYELARCLCFYGKPQEACLEIEKLRSLPQTRPLTVTFTGLIKSSMAGGHIHDCMYLYEYSKTFLTPDIGLVNAMLNVYGRNDMFLKAKELFEKTWKNDSGSENGEQSPDSFPNADEHTFSCMLETSANALQWEYFEYVYKQMILSGHPVNYRKHSSLLVEASRAGKWHLLEHAFDSILEAGEVPSASIFTEMTCQAIIQCDYERALNIVNTMALAPFQVNLKEWIDLLGKNMDRIDINSLHKLLQETIRHDLVKEATVANFSRALQFISDDSLKSAPSIDTRMDGCENRNGENFGNYMSNGRDEEDDVDSDNDIRQDVELAKCFDYHMASENSSSYLDEYDFEFGGEEEEHSDVDEVGLDLINPRSDEEYGAPSANEILEIWRSEDIRDGRQPSLKC